MQMMLRGTQNYMPAKSHVIVLFTDKPSNLLGSCETHFYVFYRLLSMSHFRELVSTHTITFPSMNEMAQCL